VQGEGRGLRPVGEHELVDEALEVFVDEGVGGGEEGLEEVGREGGLTGGEDGVEDLGGVGWVGVGAEVGEVGEEAVVVEAVEEGRQLGDGRTAGDDRKALGGRTVPS